MQFQVLSSAIIHGAWGCKLSQFLQMSALINLINAHNSSRCIIFFCAERFLSMHSFIEEIKCRYVHKICAVYFMLVLFVVYSGGGEGEGGGMCVCMFCCLVVVVFLFVLGELFFCCVWVVFVCCFGLFILFLGEDWGWG